MNEPSWSTAALGRGDADEMLAPGALGEHLQRCRGATGRGFVLRCRAESVQAFITARVITTLVVVAVLLASSAWLLR